MARRSKRVEVTGEHLVHRHLWHGAETLKHLADEKRVGRVYADLAAVLFLHFALDAFLNYVGPQLAPEAWKDERAHFGRGKHRGTLGKLNFLLDRLEVEVKRSKKPYSTLVALDQGRDKLVHPRPEPIKKRVSRTKGGVDVAEAQVYLLARPRFYTAVRADLDEICSAILTKAQPFLEHGTAGKSNAFRGGLTWQFGWPG
jgi:hypothetical protein